MILGEVAIPLWVVIVLAMAVGALLVEWRHHHIGG